MTNLIRRLVSKKKRRYNLDGFDLDLTYITERIIAMGFPSDNLEGVYRNKMADVVRFLDSRHPDKYKVYNLCSERNYDTSNFNNRVSSYPFDDHNAPTMNLVINFCRDVDEWLMKNPKNVVVIHCKAGKGRTGVMICSYLIHSGICKSFEESLEFYGVARTQNSKGVTIPSQKRYVMYYDLLIKSKKVYYDRTVLLDRIKVDSPPKLTNDNTSNIFFTIKIRDNKIFESDIQVLKLQNTLDYVLSKQIPVNGDVKIEIFHRDSFGKKNIAQFWINTFFLATNPVVLERHEIDKVVKDKKRKIFPDSFKIIFYWTNPFQAD
ncbi:phosphatases II [Rozella allomycis CSF55]|uniref:Phosphatidylinositol 3,4,5-trisphosphate 3-phosphatase and dual-specificity protein phosphatase PTEN n=1 Tax=Rozella allomycis (strain CSF55) TaxID=988480 RepID=A0A075AWU8_ROZAC|nr:Protein-tyrosine phosphatase domain-containing protein [Rozella allomycis CSF55]RKP18752.1 phosphatases II [Rozella allomycis CSF55]|eukprot:EPZ34584.1 Protein-tyrosine phosphatase domain-containing protein [Rozella allomycis CSF55]